LINILLIVSIFGFVLTTLLFFLEKSTNSKATVFLGSFYFLLSVYALQAYIVDGGHLLKFEWFFLWPLIPYNLFAVPVYFYFITVIEDKLVWKKEYFILFIPCILSIVDVCYIYFQPDSIYDNILHNAITNPKNRLHVSYWLLDLDQHMLMRHVWQLIALLVVLPKLLHFIRKDNGDRLKIILNRWLWVFWFGLVLFAVFASIYALENILGINLFAKHSLVTIILYLIIFSIGVVPVYFPTILHGYPQETQKTSELSKLKQVTVQELDNKFGLNEIEVKYKLEKFVDNGFHLRQDFDISNFAREMEMPTHHLSYFIKQQYSLTFTAFKNNLRMEHAKKLINDGFLDNNTMDALAWECGFASRSAFSKTFKNVTDHSPSEFDQLIKR
jgi:AraC-like DNA-binding protein